MTNDDIKACAAGAVAIALAWWFFRKKKPIEKSDADGGGGGIPGGIGGLLTTIIPSPDGGSTIISDDGHFVQVVSNPNTNTETTGTVKPGIKCPAPSITGASVDGSGNVIVSWTPVDSSMYNAISIQTSIDGVSWANNTGGLSSPRNIGSYMYYNGGVNTGTALPSIYVRLVGVCASGGESDPGSIRTTGANVNII